MGKRALKATPEDVTRQPVCPECEQPIAVGDVIVHWGYGRSGARHLRCVVKDHDEGASDVA